ncbi:interleukin-10 receptor subunit beta-like isoform X2 [Cyanistes caeruleus]|uniref:interleukin-10 receptor subunit beta-like isoform X2 n=1 Tax=Cyanistes caeruleus TaxID=156563 RepID=UPI000CDB8977|nr:interleukin-10 receptor subunit beta-like isoform X2 [Cyanistes caeruleus]
MIPKPRNARITSVNLHSTLQWDAPRFPEGNITYTVRSKSINIPGDSYDTLGTRLRLPECDVSSLSVYGHYVLQLRAEAGRLRSPWLTLRFKPMDDTTVGPPEVAQVDTKHNSEILSQLEPWTVYCVRVQAVIPEWNKTGELSKELCEQTTHNGVTPVWVIVTILVGSMLVVATAVTACFFSSFYLYRLTKHVFCPSYVFPEHLKEFLSKPPSALQPFPPLPNEELLVYDKLIVISEEPQSLGEGSGDEASRTPEHPEDSAQGASDSGVGAASGKT